MVSPGGTPGTRISPNVDLWTSSVQVPIHFAGIATTWAARVTLRTRLVMLVVTEIIEHPNQIAIQISGHKLAQLPSLVLKLGKDFRARRLPLREQFVHLSLAI